MTVARVLAILLLALPPLTSIAQVKQVKGKRVLFHTSEKIEIGDEVKVVDSGGKETATLKVTKGKGKQWIATVLKGSVKPGDSVETVDLGEDDLDTEFEQAAKQEPKRPLLGLWLGVGYDLGGAVRLKLKAPSTTTTAAIDIDGSESAGDTPCYAVGYSRLEARQVGFGIEVNGGGVRKTADMVEKNSGAKFPFSHSISAVLLKLNAAMPAGSALAFAEIEVGRGTLKIPEFKVDGKELAGGTIALGAALGVLLGRHHIVHVAYRSFSDSQSANGVEGQLDITQTVASYRFMF